MTSARAIEARLRELAHIGQVDVIAKRVPREQVIGVRMKHIFDLARQHQRLNLRIVDELLSSHYYESRMVAISILDARARKAMPSTPERTALFNIYMEGHQHIDTWDLGRVSQLA